MITSRLFKLLSVLLFCAVGAATHVEDVYAQTDSKGTDFVFAFLDNYTGGNLSLYIASDIGAQGTVQISGLGYVAPFSVSANGIIKVDLPRSAQYTPANAVSQRGVHILSDNEVTVYGLNQVRYSTDALMALPVDTLGLEYIPITYRSSFGTGYPSQMTIVGVYDNTEVLITPSDYANGRIAGETFSITLNSDETFYLSSGGDLTGSIIKASSPVAVMSGVKCVNILTTWCDHIVEMMPPVATWGKSFLTVPLATRIRGDVFRILASQDNTLVTINGVEVSTLARGEHYETILTSESQIESNEPVLVAQYSVGQAYDGVISDPFMMLVPPTEQFLDSYSFTTLGSEVGFNNSFVNVVIPDANIGSLSLDGALVDPLLFLPIGNSGFSGAKVQTGPGSHTINSTVPFGIYVYGFGSYDSYGYPGGMSFDFINPQGDKYPPNVKLVLLNGAIHGTAADSEDLNVNGILDAGEDLNANGIIDRRSEDLNNNGILDVGEDVNGDGFLDRDTGIFRVELEPGSQNLQIQQDNFVPGSLQATFTISRIDPVLPASGVLAVRDGAGNTTQKPIEFVDEDVLTSVRVISTISTNDIDLDASTFSVTPFSINTTTTETIIEWHFDTVSIGQIEDLSYDVVLRNPVPGESRAVTHKLDLYYTDINGSEVHSGLGGKNVDVLPSVFQINVDTDRTTYLANEDVLITTQVSNLSEFAEDATVQLSIKDASGALVPAFGGITAISLAANELRQLLSGNFFTGTIFEGQYEVHAELLDAMGQPFASAVAPFLVVSPSADKVDAGITTDKQIYDPLETIVVSDRVTNSSPNSNLEGMTAYTSVYAPDGQAFWSQSEIIPQLLPNVWKDLSYAVPLGQALPGIYRLMLVVKDDAGIERAISEAEISVRSTSETGVGLSGSLTASPNIVLKSEYVSLNAVIKNFGNGSVQDLPVNLTIVDPQNQQILVEWTETVASLSSDNQFALDREWRVMGKVGSTFVAILTATIGGENKVLAQDSFVVAEKIESDLSMGNRGRLLILMDGTIENDHNHGCNGISDLGLQLDFALPLSGSASAVVEVFDKYDNLVDTELVLINGTSVNVYPGTAGVDLRILEFNENELIVGLSGEGSYYRVLSDGYKFVTTVSNAGIAQTSESSVINTNCNSSLTMGDTYGAFEIYAIDTLEDEYDGHHGYDTSSENGAPSLVDQRYFLEQSLDQKGWYYKVVGDKQSFTDELRSGGYVTYLLLAQHVKLAEQVQKELREAVYRGEGLVVAGNSGIGNSHITQALGISYDNALANALSVDVVDSALRASGQFDLPLTEKVQRAELVDASFIGSFLFEDAGYDSGGMGGGGMGGGGMGGGYTADGDVAAAHHAYGDGKSVYVGFDLLAQATTTGADSSLVDLLTSTADFVHPDVIEPTKGSVVSMHLTLTNLGTATPGRAAITLPVGSEVINSGAAIENMPNTLTWVFDLANSETRELTYWVRLPWELGTAHTSALIQLGSDPDLIDYTVIGQDIVLTALPELAEALAQLAPLKSDNTYYYYAYNYLTAAETALNENRYSYALTKLIYAAEKLMKVNSADAKEIRNKVANAIRTAEWLLLTGS